MGGKNLLIGLAALLSTPVWAFCAPNYKLRPGETRGGAMAERRAQAERKAAQGQAAAPTPPRQVFFAAGSQPPVKPARRLGFSPAPAAPPPASEPAGLQPFAGHDFLERMAQKHERERLSGGLGESASPAASNGGLPKEIEAGPAQKTTKDAQTEAGSAAAEPELPSLPGFF